MIVVPLPRRLGQVSAEATVSRSDEPEENDLDRDLTGW
jgi:hypothetical protein